MIRVWLIRHGESESNAGLPSRDPGSIPLTARGHRQAEQIARLFAEPPALIVTSPYTRARQTAQPAISRFPAAAVQEWPVQEFTYLGDLHDRPTTAREREPWVRAYWDRADPQQASGGAESFAGLLSRLGDFLSRLRAEQSGPVAVFTHGLFMRAVAWSLLTGVTSPDEADMRRFRSFASRYLVANGSIVELRYADHGAPVLEGGSTIHLPAALAQRARSDTPKDPRDLRTAVGRRCYPLPRSRCGPAQGPLHRTPLQEETMGSQLNPYLNFNGNARQALEFYASVFGGNLSLNTFAEYGATDSPDADRIMHGMLETDAGYTIMGADVTSDMEYHPMAGFSVSLSGDDADALRGCWEKLSASGTATMPLQKQVWGDEFGMCVDEFGVSWLVNISQPPG